ncbi:MAG: Uma2 family endonuclease [Bryobacteraceae bacterium]|jgi:Uma2 family endonuclease
MEAMQVVLNDEAIFQRYCETHADLRIERSAAGKIRILPPGDWTTSVRNVEILFQLHGWTKRDGRGKGFDPSLMYLLPNGAAMCAHASWVLRSRLARLTAAQKRGFPPLCPDFVVELRSP